MKIDRHLNLVLPVDTDTGTVYVHSTPISREVFERYYLPISKTFAAIYQEGLAALAGPRVAALILRDVAEATRGKNGQANAWDGPEGVENGLMNEVRRLTNVVMPGASGWETVPFDDVRRKGMMSPDDLAEVEGALTFFIVCSAMHRKEILPDFLNGMASLWGASIVSSNCTDYARSLPISKEGESSGEKVA
jgi:hypothetical protein